MAGNKNLAEDPYERLANAIILLSYMRWEEITI